MWVWMSMPVRFMLRRSMWGVASCAGLVLVVEATRWLRGWKRCRSLGCYEAGPTGFALYRAAEAAGVPIEVIAPSKTPRAPGDRIKSDR
jgi:hypothetical protein